MNWERIIIAVITLIAGLNWNFQCGHIADLKSNLAGETLNKNFVKTERDSLKEAVDQKCKPHAINK